MYVPPGATFSATAVVGRELPAPPTPGAFAARARWSARVSVCLPLPLFPLYPSPLVPARWPQRQTDTRVHTALPCAAPPRPRAGSTVDPRPAKLSRHQRQHLAKCKEAKLPEHHRCTFGLGQETAEVLGVLDAAAVVVGMHPDEATEPIVDQCIRLGKPFAVVPCCVMPLDGSRMSKEAWFDYLAAKHPAIQRRFLNFAGANEVLYAFDFGRGRP